MNSKREIPEQRIIGIAVIAFVAFLMILFSVINSSPDGRAHTYSEATVSGPDPDAIATRDYIDSVFSALSTWRLEQLNEFLSEDTLAGMSEDQLRRVLTTLEMRLGELLYHDEPMIMADLSELEIEDNEGLAAYHFEASFEKGLAEVYLVFSTEQEKQRLYAFNIQSTPS